MCLNENDVTGINVRQQVTAGHISMHANSSRTEQRVGPQLNFVNTVQGGECCVATDVNILKRSKLRAY